jgi:hypothetical protein
MHWEYDRAPIRPGQLCVGVSRPDQPSEQRHRELDHEALALGLDQLATACELRHLELRLSVCPVCPVRLQRSRLTARVVGDEHVSDGEDGGAGKHEAGAVQHGQPQAQAEAPHPRRQATPAVVRSGSRHRAPS